MKVALSDQAISEMFENNGNMYIAPEQGQSQSTGVKNLSKT